MILSTKNTTIAYRCPSCGEAIKSVVGVFSLSGDLIRLKCHCHESELKISYTSDGKIRLSVPCFACGNDHEFIVSKENNSVATQNVKCVFQLKIQLSCLFSIFNR